MDRKATDDSPQIVARWRSPLRGWIFDRQARCNRYHNPFHFVAAELIKRQEPSGLILDVGAGTGHFALQVVNESRFELICLDPSLDMLHELRRKTAKRMVRVAVVNGCSLGTLPLREGAVDGAYCFGLLDCCQDWEGVLQPVFRTLKPGGWIVFQIHPRTLANHPATPRVDGSLDFPRVLAQRLNTMGGRIEALLPVNNLHPIEVAEVWAAKTGRELNKREIVISAFHGYMRRLFAQRAAAQLWAGLDLALAPFVPEHNRWAFIVVARAGEVSVVDRGKYRFPGLNSAEAFDPGRLATVSTDLLKGGQTEWLLTLATPLVERYLGRPAPWTEEPWYRRLRPSVEREVASWLRCGLKTRGQHYQNQAVDFFWRSMSGALMRFGRFIPGRLGR
ncbi:MAG: methyltransferase domain-containing protein [Proteobacteria bacterium]|nr:methyltransferase domain-containing protein [Pseudomonadota bacterium]MBU1741222.1 methyltransferase domain-containing protein [Pseudomonadota bacterium]